MIDPSALVKRYEQYKNVQSKEDPMGISSLGSARTDSKAPAKSSFENLLQGVVEAERTAETNVSQFAEGKSQRLHETMVSLGKADIQMTLLVNVRNKLIEAYRQVMRMS